MGERRSERLARLRAARLYLVTDDRLPLPELLDRLERALTAGARVVQFRAKSLEPAAFLRDAAEVQALCRRRGALFIVNDAADVAATLVADGLHLGQDDLPAAEARRLVGPDALVGLSVSAVEEARAAAREQVVDYLGVGAMYSTDTKPDAEYGGLALLSQVRAAVDLPLVAIGGITVGRAPEVWAAGADLVAVVSAVFGAPDPAVAVGQLLRSRPARAQPSPADPPLQ
jgi:thiamine-phosphate pyrophosphorylase